MLLLIGVCQMESLIQFRINSLNILIPAALNGNLNILQNFPKISHQFSQILIKFGFKVIYTHLYKINFTNLKHRTGKLSEWRIHKISREGFIKYPVNVI